MYPFSKHSGAYPNLQNCFDTLVGDRQSKPNRIRVYIIYLGLSPLPSSGKWRFIGLCFFRNPPVKTFNNPGKVTVTRKGDSKHLINETNRGWLDYIGDRYGGSIVSHYKDPYQPAMYSIVTSGSFDFIHKKIFYFCKGGMSSTLQKSVSWYHLASSKSGICHNRKNHLYK